MINICKKVVERLLDDSGITSEAVLEEVESRKPNWTDYLQGIKPTIVGSVADLDNVLNQIQQVGYCSLDAESTGLDPHSDNLACIQIAVPCYTDEVTALVNYHGSGPEEGVTAQVYLIVKYHLSEQEWAQCLEQIVDLLGDGTVEKILHNAAFDLKMIRAAVGRRFMCYGLFDTMIASQLITAGDFVPGEGMEAWCSKQGIEVLKEGNKVHFKSQEGLPISFERGNQKDYKPYYRKHNLQEVCVRHLGILLDKSQQTSDWSKELTPEMQQYMVYDVAVLLPLFEIFSVIIEENDLVEIAEWEFGCVQVVAEIEYSGMPFDLEKALEHLEVTQKSRKEIEKTVQDFLLKLDGDNASNININSNDHAVGVLTILAKLENVLSEDGGSFIINQEQLEISSKSEVIAILADSLPDDSLLKFFCTKLKEYRRIKIEESSLNKYVKFFNDKTQRLHTSLRQLNPQGVGRISAFKPSIQQVPRSKDFRSLFKAEDGLKLITADYSTIEMRTMADLSADEKLCQAFAEKTDVHTFTAANILGIPMNEVSKEERNSAKAFNFGLIYGMSARALKTYAKNNYRVDMSLAEAEDARVKFFKLYQGISEWHKEQRKRAFSRSFEDYTFHCYPQGYYVERRPLARTSGGRVRVWPTEKKNSRDNKPYVKKVGPVTELYNTPSQGTGADILKLAMYIFYKYITLKQGYTDVKIIGTIHDEIIVEAPEGQAAKVRDLLKVCMVRAGDYYLTVPVEVEAKISNSWADK